MADEPASAAVEVKDGKLISGEVTDKITAKIEKGKLAAIDALIVHQTGGATAASALASYKTGSTGAHFLIDTDGTICKTARITQKCWHIGKIRSRCYELKLCSADELKAVNKILFKKGEAYSVRVDKLHTYESAKAYPDRYPTNEDALGIELVGAFHSKTDAYDTVSADQNASLTWLVKALLAYAKLTAADVYRHPEVSYKTATKAKTAEWNSK